MTVGAPPLTAVSQVTRVILIAVNVFRTSAYYGYRAGTSVCYWCTVYSTVQWGEFALRKGGIIYLSNYRVPKHPLFVLQVRLGNNFQWARNPSFYVSFLSALYDYQSINSQKIKMKHKLSLIVEFTQYRNMFPFGRLLRKRDVSTSTSPLISRSSLDVWRPWQIFNVNGMKNSFPVWCRLRSTARMNGWIQ